MEKKALVYVVIIVVLMIIANVSYYFFQKKTVPDCSVAEKTAYLGGVSQGLNISIQALLFYAQDCKIATVNYSNNVYGFIDVNCLKNDTWLKIQR